MMIEVVEDVFVNWFEIRFLLIVWLLVFFLVGLYGFWKGLVFDMCWKIGLIIVVLIVIVGIGFCLIYLFYVFVFILVVFVVFWWVKFVVCVMVYKFGVGWGVVFLLLVVNVGFGGGVIDFYGEVGGSCVVILI